MSHFSRRAFLSAGTAAFALSRPDTLWAAPEIALPKDTVLRDPVTVTEIATATPIVAMTFDDGPHPTLTPRLLDMFKARGLKATFYLIGNRVVTWPDIVKRIADEGHEIGNHSWSHPNLAQRSTTSVLREIDRTSEAIYRVTGRMPVTFRPPYGAFTQRQRVMLHTERKLPTILWSVDPQDWRRPGASVVASRILSHSRPGSVILTHDIQSGTVRAMPQTLDGLTNRGLHCGTMSQMMGWPLWQDRKFVRTVSAG
jgi:peptidoglycan/xylan/chitin deacetylase (PgdA/CDA1 family)